MLLAIIISQIALFSEAGFGSDVFDVFAKLLSANEIIFASCFGGSNPTYQMLAKKEQYNVLITHREMFYT